MSGKPMRQDLHMRGSAFVLSQSDASCRPARQPERPPPSQQRTTRAGPTPNADANPHPNRTKHATMVCNSAERKALCLAMAVLAVSGASCASPFTFAKVSGSSNVITEGPDAVATSGNAAIAYKKKDATDWSLTNSATYGSSGLFGEAYGTSSTEAKTGKNKNGQFLNSLGRSFTDAYMVNHDYNPHGYANSHFIADAKTKKRPISVAAGSDVSVSTPHYVGSSAGSGAGVSTSQPSLLGNFMGLTALGGAALKSGTVDVSNPYFQG